MKSRAGRNIEADSGWKKRKLSSRARRWRLIGMATKIVGVIIAVGFLAGGGWLLGLFLVYGSDPDLPKIKGVKDYNPFQVTRVFSQDGHIIGEIHKERRTLVGLDKLPEHLINATVAAEDSRFFEHKGLDKLGMLRAFLANLRAGRYVQGGSTITQQVVKTLFLSPERTMKRKVQELILARRLEQTLTKKDILGIYLNQIYYGHGRYGVQEAARYYFDKDVKELSVEESALLAGLPQSPARLSPIRHPKEAKKRQKYVLGRMAELKYIQKEVAEKLSIKPLPLKATRYQHLGKCPEIFGEVKRDLIRRFGKKALYRLGLDVVTGCDIKAQKIAVSAVREGLRRLERRWITSQKLYPEKRWSRIYKYWKKIRKGPVKKGDTIRALVGKPLKEGGAILILGEGLKAKLLPVEGFMSVTKKKGRINHLRKGQVLTVVLLEKKKNGEFVARWEGPQAALVAIDPRTRLVRAMVGGRNFKIGEYNRALYARRQPGSAFKPVVYATAIASKKFTPASVLPDAPEVFRLWKPKNAGRRKFLGPVRLRTALAKSLNTIAIKLLSEVGVNAVHDMASKMGIKSQLTGDLSLALGSSGVTVLELTNAMATLASGGKYEDPRFIIRIGNRLFANDREEKQVLDANVAYVVTNMLTSVINEGTGRKAASIRRPAAGKTGTTNKSRDAWFVGFTPQLVTGVWVGFDDFKESLGRRESGGKTALPIWLGFMKEALKGKPVEEFSQPPGVVVKRIDPKTGLLAPPEMKNTLSEVFVEGTGPTEYAPTGEDVAPSEVLLQDILNQ